MKNDSDSDKVEREGRRFWVEKGDMGEGKGRNVVNSSKAAYIYECFIVHNLYIFM